MQSLYYLAMLIGIAWLAVWSVLPPERRRHGWWPFDMRADGAEEAGGDRPAARVGRAGRATRGGLRTAAGGEDSGFRNPPVEPGPAQSWRARREQAPPSRRER